MSESSSSIPCVIMAGGKAKPEIEALTGQSNRALVVVNDKTLLRHVVDALIPQASDLRPGFAAQASSLGPHPSGRAPSPLLGPITVIGDVPESNDYARLPDGGGFVENLFAGVEQYPKAPYVLVSTSDLPFLTSESVAAFVEGAVRKMESEADVGAIYPVVPVVLCYERFPGVKRTALKLREGEVTGGNMMLVRPASLLPVRSIIADAYAARKSPLRLAMRIGLGTVARLLISQTVAPNLLTLPYLEGAVSRLLGWQGRALLCPHPEIATDMDRPDDFAAVATPQGASRL